MHCPLPDVLTQEESLTEDEEKFATKLAPAHVPCFVTSASTMPLALEGFCCIYYHPPPVPDHPGDNVAWWDESFYFMNAFMQ